MLQFLSDFYQMRFSINLKKKKVWRVMIINMPTFLEWSCLIVQTLIPEYLGQLIMLEIIKLAVCAYL